MKTTSLTLYSKIVCYFKRAVFILLAVSVGYTLYDYSLSRPVMAVLHLSWYGPAVLLAYKQFWQQRLPVTPVVFLLALLVGISFCVQATEVTEVETKSEIAKNKDGTLTTTTRAIVKQDGKISDVDFYRDTTTREVGLLYAVFPVIFIAIGLAAYFDRPRKLMKYIGPFTAFFYIWITWEMIRGYPLKVLSIPVQNVPLVILVTILPFVAFLLPKEISPGDEIKRANIYFLIKNFVLCCSLGVLCGVVGDYLFPDIFFAGLILLFSIVLLIGAVLPKSVTKKGVIEINASIGAVWQTLTDEATLPEWFDVVTKVEPVSENPESWYLYNARGMIFLKEIKKSEKYKELEYSETQKVNPEKKFSGYTRHELEVIDSNKTLLSIILTITEPSWYRRFLRFYLGLINNTIKICLLRYKKRAEFLQKEKKLWQ